MRWATAFAVLALLPIALAGLALVAWSAHAVLAPGGSSAAPAAASSLACSVKPADPGCDTGAGEVEVFRMSSTSNAHAGTEGGSSYGNVVCCGGVTGLGNSCTGTYDTVVALSGGDNAHVATTTGGAYTTEACLSVSSGTVDCAYRTYPDDCAAGYACVATVSGDTNAHVADCDGTDDYATKVCCYAGAQAAAVGGIAELPVVAQAPASQSGSSGPPYAAIAGGLAAAVAAICAGAWYARRRWGR